MVRDLISDAIEGHEVLTAENGQEGLNLIGPYRFDLVFCDLRMPERCCASWDSRPRSHALRAKGIV